VPAFAVVGIVCGILCIKKLYAWYTQSEAKNGLQTGEDTEVDQEDIKNGDAQDASVSIK